MTRPSEDAITGFTDVYERMVSHRPFVGSLLTGHLAIEFLLRQLIQQYDARLAKHADSLRHHQLIALNHQIGTIDERQRDVLNAINSLRNKLAHQISYEPTIEQLRQLWDQAGGAVTDLTDGISQGLEALAAASSASEVEDWVLPELLVQICYDLHAAYTDRGSDVEDF